MKLQSIHIKNVASVEDAFIDFTQSPLKNAGIFLITGDMGTGKTTLLDAICLALYGNTPRLSKANGTKMDFGGQEDITPRDTRNLLRRGAREASVVLRFDDLSGTPCQATWEVSRNRNNRLNPVKRTFTRNEQTVGKEAEVKEAVHQAIGINFDQFCRTSMLAQGQFTEFLKSNEDAKAEILEKLTNTILYSQVGSQIAETTSLKRREYETQQQVVRGFNLMSLESLTQLHEEVNRLDNAITLLTDNKNQADNDLAWKTTLLQLRQELENADKEYHQLEHLTKSDAYMQECQLLKDWDATADARLWQRQIKEADTAISQCAAEELRLKQTFLTLLSGESYLEQWIGQNQQQLSQMQQQKVNEAAYSDIYDHLQTLLSELRQAEQLEQDIRRLQQDCRTLNERIPLLQQAEQQGETKRATANTNLQKQKHENQNIQQQIAEINGEAITAELQRLSQRESLLREAETRFMPIAALRKQYHEALKDKLSLMHDAERLQQEIEVQAQTVAHLQTAYDEKKRVYEAARLRVGDAARMLRAEIHQHNSEQCPVCGHDLHGVSLPTEDILLELFKPLQEDISQCDKELREAQTHQDALLRNQKGLSERTNDADRKATQSEKDYKESLLSANQAFENMGLTPIQDTDNSLSTCQLHLQSARRELNDLKQQTDKQREHLSDLQNQSLQASQRLNELTQILSDVEKGLIGIRNEKGNIAKEIESKQTLAKQYQEQRQRLISQTGTRLNVVPEWQTAWETDPTAFYNSWQQKHKDYTLLIEKIGKQTENLTKGCEALERIQSHEKNILESHPDWKPAVSPTPRQVNGLEIAFQTLNNQASGLSSKIRTHQESRHSLQNSLDTFIAENRDLNLARLTELSLISAETIAQTQARHQTMSEQRNAAKALVESKQRELEQHLTRVHSTEAENTEIQKLKEQCADLNTALTEAIRQKGIQQGLLHKDETDRNQAEAEKQKESQIKREYDQWRTLNDIFGANNGGAFKKIAQSHLLGYLLQSANYHLQKLDKRYMLECIPGTLTISLRDCYQEGVKSPVDTLSGGESFLVSLALALALASLNNKSLNIDTLFIDEGFGTLGEQEMDRVLDLLENMQRQQGKRVGIISHIEHLASRIPIQIQASRTDESRSRLRVVDTSAG